MKNKFMSKSILALAVTGSITITIATTADASNYASLSEVKKPQVKKPNVILQGQSLSQAKAALEAKLEKAKFLVAKFDQKPNIKNHREAQRAVNILPSTEVKEVKQILQNRINIILDQGLMK
ncbi:fibrinogen-binding protein [Staphylococcus aureus]|uniref:fibrinogen-binding protein n=1 Tax=Staphylococcus aureus TaxID=1280 RepID=UPI00202F53DB|nr:hypothetical protein [Staphylococcus aureus]MCM0379102.1 hypothetical protein [Staphylococcus aureus]MCM0415573.1 hypothetical protein [Staphylococcus aureus]MCM0418151.1 hypothetical protein [Staphylococcus aureus]